jgi:phospholipid transport system substrate-binding protein
VILLATLSAGGTATEAIRARDAEIRAALPPEGQALGEAGRKKIEGIVSRIVDTRSLLESALEHRWAKLTESQRKRLREAFEHRFRVSGSSQLDAWRKTKIDYLPEQREGDLVRVPTRIESQGEQSDVTYVLRDGREGWRIVDIVVDEVSTVENYRASFARIINREGVDGLIERLNRGSDAQKKKD